MITDKDYRLRENRTEYFDALYNVNLKYGVMPGLVYLYMPELAKRYSWDVEDKLWFAFLNGMTQNPITSLRLMYELPQVPPAGSTLNKFTDWFDKNWENLQYDTDRRYQKKDTIDAIKSYANLLGNFNSQEEMLTGDYQTLWKRVRDGYDSFGRLSSFSYLEYVYLNGFGADCDDLLFEDKSGSKSHRNGMMILHGADKFVWDKRMKNGFKGDYPDFEKICGWLNSAAESYLDRFARYNPETPNIGNFTFESNLCTFKNHFFGRRYPGVYADMGWSRIEWAEEKGLDVEVFKDMRAELLPTWLRAECSDTRVDINKHAAIFKLTGRPYRGEHFLDA